MKDIVRWGILGTGFIANSFAEGLRFVPNSKLIAVGSRKNSQAEKFRKRFGALRAAGSYEELAEDRDVDVIYVATPAAFHKEHSILCLEKGKSVLCEKPFALNADQAREIVTVARDKGLFCMEAMWMRFVPLMGKVFELIQQGAVGELRLITASFGTPNFYDPKDRHFDPSLGGGAMLDLGVYPLSLAIWLMGDPVSVVSRATVIDSGVDEQSAAILDYPNGGKAVVSANIRCQSSNDAFIVGSEGHIRIHPPIYRPHKMVFTKVPKPKRKNPTTHSPGPLSRIKKFPFLQDILLRMDGMLGPSLKKSERVTVVPFKGNGYNYEAAAVVDCLLSGQKECPIMPLEETLKIMELLDLMRSQWKDDTLPKRKCPDSGHE